MIPAKAILIGTIALMHPIFEAAAQTKPPAADPPKMACVRDALTQYMDEKRGLWQRSGPLFSVEAEITQRRLEEQYCLKTAACLSTGADAQTSQKMLSMMFSGCIRTESLSKYEIDPRK